MSKSNQSTSQTLSATEWAALRQVNTDILAVTGKAGKVSKYTQTRQGARSDRVTQLNRANGQSELLAAPVIHDQITESFPESPIEFSTAGADQMWGSGKRTKHPSHEHRSVTDEEIGQLTYTESDLLYRQQHADKIAAEDASAVSDLMASLFG